MKNYWAVITTGLAMGIWPGCASNRHLVFFTNTTIGVEISAEPNATTPAKFVLGYKRAEGVVDPIACDKTDSAGSGLCLLQPEGHSVLAKLAFGAKGAGADVSNAQWFASGHAARILASAPGIAGAMTGSAEIAKAAANEVALKMGIAPGIDLMKLALLDQIYALLQTDAKLDPVTAKLVSELDHIDWSADAPQFSEYKISPAGCLAVAPRPGLSSGHSFQELLIYLQALDSSVSVLKSKLDPFDVSTQIEVAGGCGPLTQPFVNIATKDYRQETDRLNILQNRLSRDPAVLAAVQHFRNSLLTQ